MTHDDITLPETHRLDSEAAVLEAKASAAPTIETGWKILVVDPDPGLADTARAALADSAFNGAGIQVLAAASAAEARAILAKAPDIGVVLLEAVLETEDAGLALVTHIRTALNNSRVRLVICTAHPDKVPERAAVEAYEISDYRVKDSFTPDALRTRVIGALRTFASLQALAVSRKGLARMMVSTVGLLELRSPDALYANLLPRLIGLLGMSRDALLCTRGDAVPRDSHLRVRAAAGRFADWQGKVFAGEEPAVAAAFARLGDASETILEPGYCALRLRAHGGIHAFVYVEGQGRHGATAQEWQLLELFRNNASIAFENALLIDELNGAQKAAVLALGSLAEYKADAPPGNLQRVQRLVDGIARELRHRGLFAEELTDELVENLGLASTLHDVGMISVSDETLNMPGELGGDDREMMRRHTAIGHRVLLDASRPLRGRSVMAVAAEIARYHHERYDGSGYLEGLRGDAIPLSARIAAVADVFDALVTDRRYRRAWKLEEAIEWIDRRSGRDFDPRVVDAFNVVIRRLLAETDDWAQPDVDGENGLGGLVQRGLRGLFGRRTPVPHG